MDAKDKVFEFVTGEPTTRALNKIEEEKKYEKRL